MTPALSIAVKAVTVILNLSDVVSPPVRPMLHPADVPPVDRRCAWELVIPELNIGPPGCPPSRAPRR